MPTTIFYGAGGNAEHGLAQWLGWGLKPVCFVDANPAKHHTLFQGKYQILPLLEAVQTYPDYALYMTAAPENVRDVYSYLQGVGVPRERIKVLEDMEPRDEHYLYTGMERIYQALSDSLSRKLFWGRHEYCLSHVLTSVYRAMIDDENMAWLKGKRTYADLRYGLKGLWQLLHENYPHQQHDIYFLGFDDAWNEYGWVVDRFLEAMPGLGIQIRACVMPYADGKYQEYKGMPCISEKEFLANIDENTRAVIGFPGWCLETGGVVEHFAAHKDILYPIADTAQPQYIEPDIFLPEEGEIFVDVGVMDFQNSLDFAEWAVKGWEKIYAFEPDPNGYQNSVARLRALDEGFSSKVELVNKGLSSYNGKDYFPVIWTGSGHHETNEMIAVDVVTLDSYLDGRPVTFVKMDVEGAEMQVLHGMEQTIRRYRPKLAVCIYHKHEDLSDIGSYLLQLVPEYKFYIRHYNSNELETVLFAKV